MKKFLACLSIAFVLITPVFAQDYGLGATADAANLRGESNPTVILGKIIGAGLSLIGIVFFVLTLYAGITWMVARGNEESAKKAINTIIAAAIGMIITMSAYAITSFILEAANQSALGSGSIPQPQNNIYTGCQCYRVDPPGSNFGSCNNDSTIQNLNDCKQMCSGLDIQEQIPGGVQGTTQRVTLDGKLCG